MGLGLEGGGRGNGLARELYCGYAGSLMYAKPPFRPNSHLPHPALLSCACAGPEGSTYASAAFPGGKYTSSFGNLSMLGVQAQVGGMVRQRVGLGGLGSLGLCERHCRVLLSACHLTACINSKALPSACCPQVRSESEEALRRARAQQAQVHKLEAVASAAVK